MPAHATPTSRIEVKLHVSAGKTSALYAVNRMQTVLTSSRAVTVCQQRRYSACRQNLSPRLSLSSLTSARPVVHQLKNSTRRRPKVSGSRYRVHAFQEYSLLPIAWVHAGIFMSLMLCPASPAHSCMQLSSLCWQTHFSRTMVGEEQPPKHEEYHFCSRPRGCYGKAYAVTQNPVP